MNTSFYRLSNDPIQERYHTNDSPETSWSVVRVDNGVECPDHERSYTIFADEGGLRHLTEDEARDVVATRNAGLNWKPGDTVDGEEIITY